MEPQIIERAQHPISRRDIHPNVLKVLYRLAHGGHAAYLVGGGVRDLMLGRKPKDFDVATSAHPSQVRDLFRNSRLIGRRFRLVHVFFGPQNIEVATFRRQAEAVADAVADNDADLLIRHDNTFGTTEEDAFRRDFTVNALFYDPATFHVIDYIGGVADLKARLIRTIGDPELRVREDPVRMIRAVRFAAKLGFAIEDGTWRAIERHREEILKASQPRLIEEIYRTITHSAAARALVLMEQLGLLAVLLPRLSDHLRASSAEPGDTLTGRNLAALEGLIAAGGEPGHAFILACLFLDLSRATAGIARPGHDILLDELRGRGFARGDTEHMRLLIDAFGLFHARARRARRLVRRPYFAEAQGLHKLLASNYGDDPADLARFLASDGSHEQAREHHPRREPTGTGGAGGESTPGGRRRKRRRGGRRHRERRHRSGGPDGAPAAAGEAAETGAPEPLPRPLSETERGV